MVRPRWNWQHWTLNSFLAYCTREAACSPMSKETSLPLHENAVITSLGVAVLLGNLPSQGWPEHHCLAERRICQQQSQYLVRIWHDSWGDQPASWLCGTLQWRSWPSASKPTGQSQLPWQWTNLVWRCLQTWCSINTTASPVKHFYQKCSTRIHQDSGSNTVSGNTVWYRKKFQGTAMKQWDKSRKWLGLLGQCHENKR